MARKQQWTVDLRVERAPMPMEHRAARRAGLLLLARILVADLPGKHQAKYHWIGAGHAWA